MCFLSHTVEKCVDHHIIVNNHAFTIVLCIIGFIFAVTYPIKKVIIIVAKIRIIIFIDKNNLSYHKYSPKEVRMFQITTVWPPMGYVIL